MAQPEYQRLLRCGFSERFLRTPNGSHPALRQAFMQHPELVQRCGECGGKYVDASKLPEPVLNKSGRDLREGVPLRNKVGYCSTHCVTEHFGGTDAEAAAALTQQVFASRPDFYRTKQWRQLRYDAIERYGNVCHACGAGPKDGVKIHVDHIVPRFWAPHRCLDIQNLQILCEHCNLGKGMRHRTDWRESA